MTARDPSRTRSALVEAALATLEEEGYSGTTARAIAARAGVNQALVFYHFGGVDSLLLAALDASAAERLERYRTVMADTPTPEAKVAAARRLFREDVDGGHVTVIAELVAASLAEPTLRPLLLERMQPWLALAEQVLTEVAGSSPLAELVRPAEAAQALVALYFGLNLLSRLDPASAQADALFDALERVAPLFGA
jgi:AcrR family transcriptional regulator